PGVAVRSSGSHTSSRAPRLSSWDFWASCPSRVMAPSAASSATRERDRPRSRARPTSRRWPSSPSGTGSIRRSAILLPLHLPVACPPAGFNPLPVAGKLDTGLIVLGPFLVNGSNIARLGHVTDGGHVAGHGEVCFLRRRAHRLIARRCRRRPTGPQTVEFGATKGEQHNGEGSQHDGDVG